MDAVRAIIRKIDKFILNPIIIFLFAIALLVFIWGIFEFLSNADNETARTKGKRAILYGVIGMVIMVGVFGIINIIIGTFGLDTPAILK